MRVKVAAILCAIILLTGCKNNVSEINKAILLRNKLLDSNGCSFSATITADYGEKIYTFTAGCKTDREGNLTFTVVEPETLAGISGKITASGGAITFDEQVLAFPALADGQITPVSAPWVFVKTLRSGYIKDCSGGDDDYQITIDDSYMDDALCLIISVAEDSPESCEIFWKGRRVLTLSIKDYSYL